MSVESAMTILILIIAFVISAKFWMSALDWATAYKAKRRIVDSHAEFMRRIIAHTLDGPTNHPSATILPLKPKPGSSVSTPPTPGKK